MRRVVLLAAVLAGTWALGQERNLEDLTSEDLFFRLGRDVTRSPAVFSAAFREDGTIVALHADNHVRLWTETGDRVIGTIDLRERLDVVFPQTSSVISPDGRRLAINSDAEVRVIDLPMGQLGPTLGDPEHEVSAAAWSPDGSRILTIGYETRLWDARTGALLWSVGRTATSGCYLSGGGEVAVVTSQCHLTFLSAKDGTVVREQARRSEVYSVTALPGDTLLVVSPGGHSVEKPTGEVLRHIRQVPPGTHAVSRDARVLFASLYDSILCWDLATGSFIRPLVGTGLDYYPTVLAVSPDGERLLSSGAEGSLRVWDWRRGLELAPRVGHTSRVLHLAQRGTLIEADTARVTTRERAALYYSLEVHADGRSAIVQKAGGGISIFDLDTWNERVVVPRHGNGTYEDQGRFTPDGQYIVCSTSIEDDWTVRVFEAESRALVATFDGHDGEKGGSRAVTVANDSDWIASAEHGRVVIWSLKKKQRVETIPLPRKATAKALAFSPDGAWLAIEAPFGAYLWDLRNRKLARTFNGHTSFVSSVAFTPDSSLLATGSWDGTVIFWKVPRP